jgi:hypothetical protein
MEGETYDAKGSCYNRIARTMDQVMELVCHLRRVNPPNRWRGEIDRNPTICCIPLKTQQYNYIILQPALVLGYINFGNRRRSFASHKSSDIVKKDENNLLDIESICNLSHRLMVD